MEQGGKPRVSMPQVWGLTLALTLGLLLFHRGVIVAHSPRLVPQGWAALPFAALLALGLAVFIGLARANRRRWRAVLRPNPGRVIGALVLGFVTPVAVYNWLPWIIGGLWLTLALPTALDGNPKPFAIGLMLVGLASFLWYPVACLIVSGIQRRWLRVALFALMFWAAYSAVLLVSGNQKFEL